MEKIKDAFLKNVPESGIVAVFVSKQNINDQETKQIFKYLDQHEFSKRFGVGLTDL